jgi:protein O-GlcNAc transferase
MRITKSKWLWVILIIILLQIVYTLLWSIRNKSSSSTKNSVDPKLEQYLHLIPPSETATTTKTTTKTIITTVNEEESYWRSYGRDKHFELCENDFGFPLIERWRAAKSLVCSPHGDQVDDRPNTSIYCHRIQQTRHSATDNFCYAENLYVDLSSMTSATNGYSQAWYGNCDKNEQEFRQNNYLQLYLNDFLGGFRGKSSSDTPKCGRRVSDKRFIFLQRDGYANLFHSFTDIINVFIALLIHKKGITANEMADNVLVILDNHPNGPYWKTWSVFGTVLRFDEFKKQYQTTNGAPTCFDHVIFGIPGGSNFIWKDCWAPNNCYESTVLQAFVRFTLKGMGLDKQRHRDVNDPIKITFSSRQVKEGGHRVGRKITNEDKLVEILKKGIYPLEGGNSASNTPIPIQVNLIEMATIPFEKQVELMRDTDIYIGMHGAGMTHVLWLPEEAVVLELHPKNWHQSSMRNLSKNMGKTYLAWHNIHDKNVVDEKALWTHVEEEEFTRVIQSAVQNVLSFHQGTGIHSTRFNRLPNTDY